VINRSFVSFGLGQSIRRVRAWKRYTR